MDKADIRSARIASNLTAEQASSVVGLSRNVYYGKERNPERFTLKQLKALEDAFSNKGKQILVSSLVDFFSTSS